jgi:hypothetical protein
LIRRKSRKKIKTNKGKMKKMKEMSCAKRGKHHASARRSVDANVVNLRKNRKAGILFLRSRHETIVILNWDKFRKKNKTNKSKRCTSCTFCFSLFAFRLFNIAVRL